MDKQNDWRNKFQEVFQVCSEELKKTTEIGKKMLSASKTNTTLHETYEELGVLVARAIKNNELQWDNEKVQKLLMKIEGCESDLKGIEEEVNDIRFSEEEAAKNNEEKN
ncbi:MAG: hypothetical protein K9K67_04965 [Bacteriovoracaceae bacterium]|nr:hypothetical protein [Bacteriovoracaceae bacterium]